MEGLDVGRHWAVFFCLYVCYLICWVGRHLRHVDCHKVIGYKLWVFWISDYLVIKTLKIIVKDEAQEERRKGRQDVNSWTIPSIEHLIYFATHWDSLSGILWILKGRMWRASKRTSLTWGLQGIRRCLSLRRYLVSNVRSKVMWLPSSFSVVLF